MEENQTRAAKRQGSEKKKDHQPHLDFAFYCRLLHVSVSATSEQLETGCDLCGQRWRTVETWRVGCVLISMQSNPCRDSRDLQRLQFSFFLCGRVLPVGRPDAVERSNLGYE